VNRAAAPRLPIRADRFPALLAAGGLVLLTAGCGLVGSTTTASSASSAAPSGSASAYQACLRQHGVAIPTARPTARPASGFGGLGAGSGSTFAKAAQACASLRPSGSGGGFGGAGFGGGGSGGFASALAAFRSCMAAHGETIPATRPTASPSPAPSGSSFADRLLNGLNPDNAKVAAALKACQSKLPSFTPGG